MAKIQYGVKPDIKYARRCIDIAELPHDLFRTAVADTDAMPHVDVAVATQPTPVPLATWVDDESQRGYPRRWLHLISQSTRVVGSNTAVHENFVEDELRVVADDRHPRVPPNDVDELESPKLLRVFHAEGRQRSRQLCGLWTTWIWTQSVTRSVRHADIPHFLRGPFRICMVQRC